MTVTFDLDDAVLSAIKRAVETGHAPSEEAFVEKALRRELRLLRDQHDEALWAASLKDAQFQAELRDIEQAFAEADLETWPPY